jgi:hypothetical protein
MENLKFGTLQVGMDRQFSKRSERTDFESDSGVDLGRLARFVEGRPGEMLLSTVTGQESVTHLKTVIVSQRQVYCNS